MKNLIPFLSALALIALGTTATAKVATFEEVYPHRIKTKTDEFLARWRFNENRDAFDDSTMLSAQSSAPAGGTIGFYCLRGKELVVEFSPGDPVIAFGLATVQWRVDKEKALKQDWNLTSSMEALQARGGIAHGMALAVMKASHSLLIGVNGQTARFWLEGARQSLAKVLEGCGRSFTKS